MKKGFTLIELLAVIIVLAIVALIATPIVLNVIEDSKKSAAESEANLILSGLTTYCQTEDSKVQMGTLDGDRKCSDNMSEAVIKELVPNISSTTKIEEVKYENGKIISLKVESNGHKFELNENGSMVNGDDALEGIKIATSPTHKFHLFGETFLIDSNTTWQQLIDGSNGVAVVVERGSFGALEVNGNGGLMWHNRGSFGSPGVDMFKEGNSTIFATFGSQTTSVGGTFLITEGILNKYWDESCPGCGFQFNDVAHEINEIGYLESI